jgi:hypothetical protein
MYNAGRRERQAAPRRPLATFGRSKRPIMTEPKVDAVPTWLNPELSAFERRREYLRALAEGRVTIEPAEASPGD